MRIKRTVRLTVNGDPYEIDVPTNRLLVDLLNEVSERTQLSTNAGIVRLYERWKKTGSERLASLLAGQGVTLSLKGFVQ